MFDASISLCVFCYFVLSWISFIINRPNWLPVVRKLIHSFVEIFSKLRLLKTFVFKNIFGFLSFVIFFCVFRSICSSVSVNIVHIPFPVSYILIFITVSASSICFSSLLLLLLQDFIKILHTFLYIGTFKRTFVFCFF